MEAAVRDSKKIVVVCDLSTKPWLSDKEAQVYTSLSKDYLRRARIEGRIAYREIAANRIIYAREDLDKFLLKQKHYKASDEIIKTRK